MKTGIHPQYDNKVTAKCVCGATYDVGSTVLKEISTEICSACHPFYTGKSKILDTAGRVDIFKKKLEKARVAKMSKTTATENELVENAEAPAELVEKTEKKKATPRKKVAKKK